MCKIVGINNIDKKTILDCSEYEGEFENAKTLKITTQEGENIIITNFVLEKNRNCFSDSNNPWVAIMDIVSEKFLKIGNDVEFI